MTDISRVIQGARGFGVGLRLGDDDALAYDARQEPSQAILDGISKHRDAIVALLQARRAAAAIEWGALSGIDVDGYAALVASVKADIEALQNSIDRLERAAAAILPRMRDKLIPWDQAIRELLAERYNSKYANRRPKNCSDPEWLAALHSARLLEQNGPQPPRGLIG